MPRKDAGGPINAQGQQDLVADGIENFELPKSLVTRIARSAIPENAKLQKETVLSIVKGSTVFINYLAATSHQIAVQKQHKSITAADVLKALELLEFGDLVEQFQGELNVYRELAKTDKTKKGNSNTVAVLPRGPKASGPGTASAVASVSQSVTGAPPKSSSKGKGKARADQTESISSGTMDVDDEIPFGEGEQAENGVGQETEDEVVGDDAQDDDIGDEEPEELVDKMAIEEEEIRHDAKGIEDKVPVMHAPNVSDVMEE